MLEREFIIILFVNIQANGRETGSGAQGTNFTHTRCRDGLALVASRYIFVCRAHSVPRQALRRLVSLRLAAGLCR